MGTVTRDEALAHAQDILAATPLPVSGDFENGFGDAPEEVAETIRLAGEIGLSGCGIEDSQVAVGQVPPYAFDLAVERIRAAASAARALGRPFVLVARADGILTGQYDLDEAIRRLQAFEEAGADCLYAPLPGHRPELERILASVSKPVNALAVGPLAKLSRNDFAEIGVRRISVGSAIARVTHRALLDTTQAILRDGDFVPLRGGAASTEIDPLLEEGAGDG